MTSSSNGIDTESFSYDAIGNRVADSSGANQYDATAQRLVSDSNFTYSYDLNGNLAQKIPKDTSKSAYVYSYSASNQLTRVQITSSSIGQVIKQIDYVYDVLGRRMQKTVWDQANQLDPKKTYTRKYGYDGENVIYEYDGANSILASYTHSPLASDDILAATLTADAVSAGLAVSSGTYHFLKDGNGTISDVTTSTGAIVQHYDYGAFGKISKITNSDGVDITSAPQVSTSYTFTGREIETESGLYYYRARYYDPGTGRFLQQDPHPGQTKNPNSISNRYVYAENNPISKIDPSGASSIFGWATAAAFPLQSLFAMNTSDFFQKNFGFSDGDIRIFNGVSLAVLIVAASFATGGAAAGSIGAHGLGGALVGAGVGAATGAAIGAVGFPALGLGTSIQGMALGAALGGIAGGFGGASAYSPTHFADNGMSNILREAVNSMACVSSIETVGKLLTVGGGITMFVGLFTPPGLLIGGAFLGSVGLLTTAFAPNMCGGI